MSRTRLTWIQFVLRKVLPALLVLGVGTAAMSALVLSKKPPEQANTTRPLLKVSTRTVERYGGPIYVEANGLVVPHREIILASQVSGTIANKSTDCQAGHWVAEGTPLIELDPRDYEIALESAAAEAEQARVQLDELADEIQNASQLLKFAQQELEIQENETQRMEDLGRNVSASERDKARKNLIAAQNKVSSQQHQLTLLGTRKARLQAALNLASLREEKAKLDLARCVIAAPSDGVIVAENVEQGTYVQPGTQLLIFEDTTKAEVEFNLRVDELYWIMQDQRAVALPEEPNLGGSFQLPAIDDVIVEFRVENEVMLWQGHLEGFASYGVDEQTRNVPCRVVVDQPLAAENRGISTLRRGMFVAVKIPVRPRIPMVRFPESALKASDTVWVVSPSDERLHKVTTQVAGRFTEAQLAQLDESFRPSYVSTPVSSQQVMQDTYWLIAKEQDTGLRQDSQVVISPMTFPFEGQEVELADELESEADSETAPTGPDASVSDQRSASS